MSLPRKRKKKASSTFLKDPLESIAVHIGHVVDNASVKDLSDLAINAGLAYVGQQAFGFPHGLLVGPVAYKLATNTGGGALGSPSQVAGLAMLGFMGLNLVGKPEDPTVIYGDIPLMEEGMMCEPPKVDIYRGGSVSCRKGYIMHQDSQGNFTCCIPVAEPEPPHDPGLKDPIPDPPAESWGSFFTDGVFICSRHYCGATECALTPQQLASQKLQHDASHEFPSDGVE